MEVITIEKNTFEEMIGRFNYFICQLDAIFEHYSEKRMNNWLDNQDVCRILNISSRTLQTLRDNGILAYSQISHKIYYRPEDVQHIVPIVENKRKETKLRNKNSLR